MNDTTRHDPGNDAERVGQLNPHQREALGELEQLGWTVEFVHKPPCEDPVPVVFGEGNREIGLLDSDGRIVPDRCSTPGQGDDGPVERHVPEVPAARHERRRGEPPVPRQLSKFLNASQMMTLRQMENFGWTLKFVRRPLFQDPVAVITDADGTRFATLEADGNIEVRNDLEMRREEEEEAKGAEAAGGKQAE